MERQINEVGFTTLQGAIAHGCNSTNYKSMKKNGNHYFCDFTNGKTYIINYWGTPSQFHWMADLQETNIPVKEFI